MGFGTDPLPQAAADLYIWNRSKWGVPGVELRILLTHFGDYDANTIPGVETEASIPAGSQRSPI